MSGTQFVCETVIRSLTLDAAPDHQPPQKKKSFHSECFQIPFEKLAYSENTYNVIDHFLFFCYC